MFWLRNKKKIFFCYTLLFVGLNEYHRSRSLCGGEKDKCIFRLIIDMGSITDVIDTRTWTKV